jgi:GTP cyclohydrolase II
MSLRKKKPQLKILARTPLPTRHGLFEISIFRWGPGNVSLGLSPDHIAIVMGDVSGKPDVLLRIHSECLTSEVFGSVLCDCREQLETAQAEIARAGAGVLLYLRQEGRGIGITNKVRAYQLQANGHDTVDANRLLGLPDDGRDYSAAVAMLSHLGVASVRLMTNNPTKVQALRDMGVAVRAQCAAVRADHPRAAHYLETKRLRMGHALPPLKEWCVEAAGDQTSS